MALRAEADVEDRRRIAMSQYDEHDRERRHVELREHHVALDAVVEEAETAAQNHLVVPRRIREAEARHPQVAAVRPFRGPLQPLPSRSFRKRGSSLLPWPPCRRRRLVSPSVHLAPVSSWHGTLLPRRRLTPSGGRPRRPARSRRQPAALRRPTIRMPRPSPAPPTFTLSRR